MARNSNHPGRRLRTFPVRLSLLLATALVTTCSPAQTSPAATPQIPQTFEVASIRLAEPYSEDEVRSGVANKPWSSFPTNRFTATRLTLKLIIGLAYGVDQQHVQGDPEWLDSQHYTVAAKVEGDKALTYEQIKPLLQNMLEERFHLAIHRISKFTAGYALVVAKDGPKLRSSKEGGEPHMYILPDGIEMSHASVTNFAAALSSRGAVGGPVIDKTGIPGDYDVSLHYAPNNDSSSDQPDIFTAVQGQLGLKLESQKVPVDFLVIDHVDRIPTDN